ncbi:hypothetical protein J1N35_012886 [Gossypium stocksii]|uniref:DYW domain-containing protein n=1 Tax=Gossypium stocksii TaxID=47602 RepID=A0A9D3VRG3_9ROSI|nr:hypothetical protein J1N35_012886 [Gossypium stocksii]
MVVHDLENEEKEESMKVHSERLAVAWGLIGTEPGTTLTIIKNLQTCGDCHSFLKFTSKVTGRHLIVRDGQRSWDFNLCLEKNVVSEKTSRTLSLGETIEGKMDRTEAISLLDRMMNGVHPNAVTFNSVINALCKEKRMG